MITIHFSEPLKVGDIQATGMFVLQKSTYSVEGAKQLYASYKGTKWGETDLGCTGRHSLSVSIKEGSSLYSLICTASREELIRIGNLLQRIECDNEDIFNKPDNSLVSVLIYPNSVLFWFDWIDKEQKAKYVEDAAQYHTEVIR